MGVETSLGGRTWSRWNSRCTGPGVALCARNGQESAGLGQCDRGGRRCWGHAVWGAREGFHTDVGPSSCRFSGAGSGGSETKGAPDMAQGWGRDRAGAPGAGAPGPAGSLVLIHI